VVAREQKNISISPRTVERLFRYKAILHNFLAQGKTAVFSHDLAAEMHATAAQVRRDLMEINLKGSPQRGYDAADSIAHIDEFLQVNNVAKKAALIGLGRLGSALLSYFHNRSVYVSIAAAFDKVLPSEETDFEECPVYTMDRLEEVVRDKKISIGIIAVPASSAREVADQLVAAGVRGIINFAPAPLKVPEHVYLENVDITLAIEKTAFYSQRVPQVSL
jgi:redox-sensing transcriptional repressor